MEENTMELSENSVQATAAETKMQETAAENNTGDAKANYTPETDATKRYSERLNKDRAKIRQEFERELNMYKDIEASLKAMGYEGANSEALLEEIKKRNENTADDAGSGENSADMIADNGDYDEKILTNPIVQRALEVAAIHKRMQDLDAIKKAYPECNATDSRNIGEVFTRLMQTGEIDAVVAYEAQMAYNKRQGVQKVETMGSVKADEINAVKDFYTPEEAGKFTRKDYERNPGLWEKVRNSMLRW